MRDEKRVMTCLAALKHLFVNVVHHSIGPIQIDGLVQIDLTSDPTALLRVSDASRSPAYVCRRTLKRNTTSS